MPVKSNMTKEELKAFRRAQYELEKEGLIQFFKEQKYEKKDLNMFLVNSLKGCEEFLKEDKLI
jgi:hypothetical protein